MIGQPIRVKGLSSLLGNVVYLTTLTFPSWAGMALMFYSLTMFEIAPLSIRQHLRGWFKGTSSSNS